MRRPPVQYRPSEDLELKINRNFRIGFVLLIVECSFLYGAYDAASVGMKSGWATGYVLSKSAMVLPVWLAAFLFLLVAVAAPLLGSIAWRRVHASA
ncbi:hypothetical protein EON81_13790 [bacterium]|nr:MAG: hypothetical protein EON81_13790 [bacterium]